MLKKLYQKSSGIYFSSLVKSLLTKLLNAPNKYNLESVLQYYLKLIIAKSNLVPRALSSYSENIRWGQVCAKPSHLIDTSALEVLKIMQNIDILKASGIDKFPGKILKDGAEILAKSITEICNLPITSRTFSIAYKVVKLKPIFKKGKKIARSYYRPISLLPLVSKFLKGFYMTKQMN